MEKVCDFCGESFQSSGNQRFCKSPHVVPCDDCGEDFTPNARKVRENLRVCSPCLKERHRALMKKLTSEGSVGFKNPANQLAAKKAVLEKFGVANVSQAPEVQERRRQTFQERFGADSPFESEAVRRKIAATNLERYGAENPFASAEVIEKIRGTLKERYGVENVTLHPETRAKQLESMQKNHGVNQPLENAAIKLRQEQTLQELYGVSNSAELPHVRALSRERLMLVPDEEFIEGVKLLASESPNGKASPEALRELFGYQNLSPVYKRIRKLSLEEKVSYRDSAVNLRWAALLEKELGVKPEAEGAIFSNKRWKADLYFPEKRVAVDINPTISHSTQKPHPFYTPKPVKYHQERALDAEAQGWTLYQIYDWTAPEKAVAQLRNLLGLNERAVMARACSVVRPSREKVAAFLNEQHLQGSDAVGSLYFGLEHEGELVQVMTFSKARFRGAVAEYELIRLASAGTVVGGASKLFTAFQRELKPSSVQTYASLDTGHGGVYEKLGFVYRGLAGLNALYALPGSSEAYKTTVCSSKFGNEYRALGLTQKEFMNGRGFFRINDAGSKIFLWTSAEKDQKSQKVVRTKSTVKGGTRG